MLRYAISSLIVILVSYPLFALAVSLNSSSTLNPIKFAETVSNEYYPFMYEVSPVISFIIANETLRKNFTIGNPYSDAEQIVVGDTSFWKVRYCGVHFMNKGEGYILSDEAFEDVSQDDPKIRCIWGFVGDGFCTPQIECPKFQDKKGNCQTNYLQMTDAGDSFLLHFCDEKSKPDTTPYTAKNGVLDVVYRYSSPKKRPEFECWVKCVNYNVNYTVTGSNAVGNETLKVTFHDDPIIVKDTIPQPNMKKNCKCGVQNGGSVNRTHRIVGGRETLVNQYPWTLGLMNRVGKLPYCGASLISAEYVLTAMHCVEDEDLEDIIVALNEHDFFNDTETVGRTVRRNVVEVIPYHYYMESTFFGDYALLKLNRPVDIAVPTFTPVCLPYKEDELFQGREVIAAGWGTTNGGPFSQKSPKLLEVPMVVFSNQACNDYHGHTPPEPPQVSENMLCAGFPEGGRDTCAGDSGGPLIIKMKDSGRFSQIGVTSWGFGCAIRLNPGVFSRVSAFMYWIRMHTVDGHYCTS